MSTPLDIHPADDAERIDAFRNVHDVWGQGLSVDDHLKRRLSSPQHNRATWYVGCLDGRVVASLGSYPLQLTYRGDVVDAVAIGAVHTLAEFRGRGFAPQVMTFVERAAADDGAALAMLYSDIAPGYYARLGYVECPSLEWNVPPADLSAAEFSEEATGGEFTLRRDSAAKSRRIVKELYEEFHEAFPLSIHRDEEYWDFIDDKGRGDDVYLLSDAAREPLGYLRVSFGVDGKLLKLRDFGMRLSAEESLDALTIAVLRVARERGAERIGGWVPPMPERLAFTRPQPRSMEVSMLKPLRDDVAVDAAVRDAAGFFHEIDHV